MATKIWQQKIWQQKIFLGPQEQFVGVRIARLKHLEGLDVRVDREAEHPELVRQLGLDGRLAHLGRCQLPLRLVRLALLGLCTIKRCNGVPGSTQVGRERRQQEGTAGCVANPDCNFWFTFASVVWKSSFAPQYFSKFGSSG